MLSGYQLCKTGLKQSPIDITADNSSAAVLRNGILAVDWKTVPSFIFSKDANTVSGPLPALSNGTITYENTGFKPANIHFHAPSEHAFKGERTAMEVHIVHMVRFLIMIQ